MTQAQKPDSPCSDSRREAEHGDFLEPERILNTRDSEGWGRRTEDGGHWAPKWSGRRGISTPALHCTGICVLHNNLFIFLKELEGRTYILNTKKWCFQRDRNDTYSGLIITVAHISTLSRYTPQMYTTIIQQFLNCKSVTILFK